MHLASQILAAIGGALALQCIFLISKEIYRVFTSPLRALPGPPKASWIWGNDRQIDQTDDRFLIKRWFTEYGPNFRVKWLFFQDRLYTADTRAISHILANDHIYQKSDLVRWLLGRIVGEGVLITEDDKHKVQRKVMNPAFGPAQIRELTEIFVEESVHLKDIWASQVVDEKGVARIDVQAWLSRMTLDVIGRAGFNYNFNALNPHQEPNELNKAFTVMFGDIIRLSAWNFVQGFFPTLRLLPDGRGAAVDSAHKTMNRIGHELIREDKAFLLGTGEKDGIAQPRDLLSLLIRSNMIGEQAGSQYMSDEDILAQVPTFLVAGHETTSTATTWALYALTQNIEAQNKLRAELQSMATENPTMDQLNALTYLDLVVRETLRIYSPVERVQREAMKDDVIPLSQPFKDSKGVLQTEIHIRKGQSVILPFLEMNRDEALWGQDASEFRPERWEKLPDAVSSIPGIWGNVMSFGAGQHACIGYRFSLVEMKALLYVLIRAFEFELGVPNEDITAQGSVVLRPRLKSQPDAGSQLPLLVKLCSH